MIENAYTIQLQREAEIEAELAWWHKHTGFISRSASSSSNHDNHSLAIHYKRSSTISVFCLLSSSHHSPLIKPPLSRNTAFANALEQHLAKLSPVESAAFRTSHQSLTAENILLKVKEYDQAYNRGSASRKCADKVDKSLKILNLFLASVAIAIQSNPDISSLIVGGLRLIVDVIILWKTETPCIVANALLVFLACGELRDFLQQIDGYDWNPFWLLRYSTGIWSCFWWIRPY